jgi:hypothetical protein
MTRSIILLQKSLNQNQKIPEKGAYRAKTAAGVG